MSKAATPPTQQSLFNDKGHRPHADHRYVPPVVLKDRGPYGLRVSLDSWGPNDGKFFANVFNQAQATWGDNPARVKLDIDLTEQDWIFVSDVFAGKHLSNALEALSFSFLVDGCTRAATHELVRTRVGASFHQHGGRDNDWRMRRWTIPEVLARISDADRNGTTLPETLSSKLLKKKFFEYLTEQGLRLDGFNLALLTDSIPGGEIDRILDVDLMMQKAFYAASVDAGLPWQDARRILGIGHQTYLHCNYNYLALKGVLGHRLEHGSMDWEIDCIAQLMLCEIHRKCHSCISSSLMSNSDRAKCNKYATLALFPPNGKWSNPSDYDSNKKTKFSRDQMPFWVLDPRCYQDVDRPIEWISTNGEFPWDEYNKRKITP